MTSKMYKSNLSEKALIGYRCCLTSIISICDETNMIFVSSDFKRNRT